MTESSIHHASFTVERRYSASPAQVFAAWADIEAKRRWFVDADGTDWEALDYGLDFRVGGREHGAFRHRGKTVHGNETVYLDIVEPARIAFAYSMSLDGAITSASLATVELAPDGGGTRLTYTEQGAFFDGLDKVEYREEGWKELLKSLDATLAT
ncbi:MAG: SRPBCC family protein [Rhodovibrionaceae bacterium]